MLTANVHKTFTASRDPEAEQLLADVLQKMGAELSSTGLTVCLGGSYGRGEGGVRQDRDKGILYNDLDFFVFGKKSRQHETLLKEISHRYEKMLHIDVDFSRITDPGEIKSSARRLMMQELKRSYALVCGPDVLAALLPEFPASALPFSECCRLLLNRGMGLLLAGEKIARNASDTDFILRNINKALLGTGDAMLIASGNYKWRLAERKEALKALGLSAEYQALYERAAAFKSAPTAQGVTDLLSFWQQAKGFYLAGLFRCAGCQQTDDLLKHLYDRCSESDELSFIHFFKYCLKSRSFCCRGMKYFFLPPVAQLLPGVSAALQHSAPVSLDRSGRLYRQWLLFN
jgi:hypothetical protein